MRVTLRAGSFIPVVVGALGSVGLTLYAGRHNDSRLLVALFAIWVLSPFIAVLIASRRWWAFARRLVVPLASWLLLTMVVVIAALVSGVLSRRDVSNREHG